MELKQIRLFNIYGFSGGNYAGNVYDKNGIAPTIRTFGGGNQQPMIIEDKVWIKKKDESESESLPLENVGD